MRAKLVLGALAALALVTPALADECKPLQLLNTVSMKPLGDKGLMLVPVSMNGTDKQMLLSTAGAITTVNQAAIDSLGLHPSESNLRLLDTNGNASKYYVRLETFQIGSMLGKHVGLMVSTNPDAGESQGFDGAIAGDMLDRYDIEMDFAAHKLNYFSPDHCPDRVVYWPATAVAMVPITQNRPVTPNERVGNLQNARDTHIRVPVTLDGKQFWATINTSSVRSTMSAATAKFVFGITADSPGSVSLGTARNDSSQKIFGHVFDALAFDGVTVLHPHITILPDLIGSKDPDNTLETGSRIQHVDDGLGSEVTIGMDVLSHLHLYIAYRADKLYVTAAASGAAPP